MLPMRDALCFDDVLLVPKFSSISSRKEIDVSIILPKVKTKLTNPIVVSNMKTLIGYEMAAAIIKSGGLALLHRFEPLADQLSLWKRLSDSFGMNLVSSHAGMSIGVKEDDYANLPLIVSLGIKIINVDVAHGDSEVCHKMVSHISKEFPHVCLIAGNVATKQAAKSLWRRGADVVRTNVGSGSLCSTRIETGNGVPTITCLMDAAEAKQEILTEGFSDKLIMNDGGARNAGDCVKSLCFADLQMCGNIFAGCKETPTQDLVIEGKIFRSYVGSSTHKANHVEGVAALVPAKGHYHEILERLLEGIKSGCSYQGAANLTELKINPEFIRISSAGMVESRPHDVILR